VSGQTVGAVLAGAAGALRAGGVLVRDGKAAWVMPACAEVVECVAELIAAGPGWSDAHGDALRSGVMNALLHVPNVRGHEGRDVGRGVAALVALSRRWAGL
jgi:hypothetical protein